jgi:hypothetical protein
MTLSETIQKLRQVLANEGCQIDDVDDTSIMVAACILEETVSQYQESESNASFPVPKQASD